MKLISYRKGYLVISLTSIVSLLTFSVIMRLFNNSAEEFYAVVNDSKLTKARYLALSSIEIVHSLLRKFDYKLLYQYGFLPESPPIPIGMLTGGGDSIIKYTVTEETGKINVNTLVKFSENREDLRTREMLNRLSQNLGINSYIWDGVTDYIDFDDTPMPNGFEKSDYEKLEPPRRIKNARLHALDELLLIPGFSHRVLYEDLRSEEKKQEYSLDFASEEEKLAIDEENDFKLAESLTTYLPEGAADKEIDIKKININSANINVLMSLSDDITLNIAKAIIMAKLGSDSGRFENESDIQKIPELNQDSVYGNGQKIHEYLLRNITTKDRIYKIVAEASVGSQTASVMSIFDMNLKKVLMYFE